ncbi:unnamed protein product [Polarella glacialis]|uniref:Uncharacterized protein n=1 Tax=Polarella glacialis TaxID=89957 RepID=A0A813LXJ9_POLGL|nr:unnamed protein product [Polarella glacialis]
MAAPGGRAMQIQKCFLLSGTAGSAGLGVGLVFVATGPMRHDVILRHLEPCASFATAMLVLAATACALGGNDASPSDLHRGASSKYRFQEPCTGAVTFEVLACIS